MKTRWLTILLFMSVIMTGCQKQNTIEQVIPAESEESMNRETQATQSSSIEIEQEEKEMTQASYSRVSVHDPSVVYDKGTYYIFGSHMAWAKSTDLMNWESFSMNINEAYPNLFQKEWETYCKTETNPELKGNLWAPDVIYNEAMQKYCMYMSVNGNDWNSVIVMLTADSIEGPYDYAGPVVYSGFNESSHDVALTDVNQVLGEGADLTRYQSVKNTKLNCIDPCVTYDEEGNLWMTYGSWFGGIYLLKLDAQTGFRDYDTVYETIPNESDAYYGKKLAGGFGVSGEGPYIIYKEGYYYLFLSYGGLVTDGGYQIRVFRSEKITGPYVDQNGTSAIFTKEMNNLFSDTGIRLMGSYDWTGNREIRVAQGHNSAYATEEGEMFLVYHTRFANGKNGIEQAHEVRVQQMFMTKDHWLVCAPYEYANETIQEQGYTMEQMSGTYEFILHTPTTYFQKAGTKTIGIQQAETVTLSADGTVSGDYEGTWSYEEGTPNMTLHIGEATYEGVFVEMPSEKLYFDQNQREITMTFTVIGNNVTAWGSK